MFEQVFVQNDLCQEKAETLTDLYIHIWVSLALSALDLFLDKAECFIGWSIQSADVPVSVCYRNKYSIIV